MGAKKTKGEADALKALSDFPLDGRERFIPSVFKIALGRTWHPAFSPSTVIERRGPVVLGWPVFARVLDDLKSFAGREGFLGEWSRAELQAVDAALGGKPLALKRGHPLCETLETGSDHWLVNTFEHLTGNGLTPRDAYRELARVRHVGVQAMAMKFSRLRHAADRRLRENPDAVRAAAALGWTSGLEVSKGMKRRRLVERQQRTRPDSPKDEALWARRARLMVERGEMRRE